MKLAQMKWIGLAVLATSLSAGSVVAVGYASAPVQEAATTGVRPAVGPQDQPPVASKPTEARLKALEDKIDRLMKLLETSSSPPPTDPRARPEPEYEPTPLKPAREVQFRLPVAPPGRQSEGSSRRR